VDALPVPEPGQSQTDSILELFARSDPDFLCTGASSHGTAPARNVDPLLSARRGFTRIVYETRGETKEASEKSRSFRGAKVSTGDDTDGSNSLGPCGSCMADGREVLDHAGDWRCDGRIRSGTTIAWFPFTAVGDRHPDVVVIRFVNRQLVLCLPFPASMSSQERFVAHASEVLLYTLCLCCRLSAGGCCPQPIFRLSCLGHCIFFPSFRTGDAVPVLRRRTRFLAYLLFLAFVAHFGAILFQHADCARREA